MRKLSFSRRGAVISGGVLAAALVAGGATAFAATTGSASGASGTSATTHAAATAAAARTHRHRRAPFGIHGEATTKNRKTGQFVEHEWQRGTITSVSGATFTVRSVDGTSWTWTSTAGTKVRRDGKAIAESTLKSGDKVIVVGRQNGSVNDAVRVFAPVKRS